MVQGNFAPPPDVLELGHDALYGPSDLDDVIVGDNSIDSSSGFSFLQSHDNGEASGDVSPSWTTRWCRAYSPARMLVVCVIVAISFAAMVFLGFVLQQEITDDKTLPNETWVPEITSWDMLVYSLPNSCRVLSILGVLTVMLCYVLKRTFRFNSMPLFMPLLLSQLGFLTSRFYVAIAPLITEWQDRVDPWASTTSRANASVIVTPRANNSSFMCNTTSYCGLPSSILTTSFNLSQIAFTIAITLRLLQSVGSPVEALCDSRQLDKMLNRWIVVIVGMSCAVAIAISWATHDAAPTQCQYNMYVCMSKETQMLNNMIAPAVGLGTVTVLYYRIRGKIQDLYPTNARRTFKSVATHHIVVFVVTWGISLFMFSLLTILRELPDQESQSQTVAWFKLAKDEMLAMRVKTELMLLTFVPYDLQGFLTSVVALWSYFRLRTRFDLGLSLKAINPASIEFDEPLAILGQGAFAVVVKATWFPSRQLEYGSVLDCMLQRNPSHGMKPRTMTARRQQSLPVAVKTFKLERNSANSTLNGIQEEAYLASKLVHPNIMATYGCYTVGSTLYLVCEYLGGGTLQDVIDTVQPLPYEQVLLYALQIASGMEFLHGLAVPVIHRDLKPLNCCFDQTHTTLKLVDFGFSRLFRADPSTSKHPTSTPRTTTTTTDKDLDTRRTNLPLFSSATSRFSRLPDPPHESSDGSSSPALLMTSRVGTVCWAAPEVLSEEEQTMYSLKVDVYSFGIICWQLYTGKQPYSDIPGSVLAVEEAVLQGTRPRIPDDCPVHFAKLMRRAWHANPDRRPSFADIVRVLMGELNQFHLYGTARSEPPSPCDLD